jgi:hypothetical protein
MSVIIAYPDGNSTWIASDTLAVGPGGRIYNVGPKWYEGCDGWWFGAIGSSRYTDIVRTQIKWLTDGLGVSFAGKSEVEGPADDFVARLMEALRCRDIKPHYDGTDTVPIWCDGGLLARAGEAWDIDGQLSIMKIEPGTLWARGAGADVAMGAAWALKGDPPVKVCSVALQAVIHLNAHVAGHWHRRLDPATCQVEPGVETAA